MKTVIRKAYWNYEKEEKWLNEMSANGLALTDYSWCRYVFADCRPGEYIYRIDLLKNAPAHPESRKYLSFMEENHIEHVASYMRWVYFRKKASDGAFDIYSDIDSKISHYQRVFLLWMCAAFAELAIGVSNLSLGVIYNISSLDSLLHVNLILGAVVTALGLLFLTLGLSVRKKIKTLMSEKRIRA